MIEAIDELKGTPFYRHRIKAMANTLHDNMLADINKTISDLYNKDEELMLHMSRCIDAIIESLAKDTPAVIASYPRMIEMVRQEEIKYNNNGNNNQEPETEMG
jgi:hypothetical protein